MSKPLWHPEFNSEYQKWTASYMRHHGWRVDSTIYEQKDLMQEAWLVFDHLVKTYPNITSPIQFFNYYKRAIINKINDLSCRKNRRKNSIENPLSTDIYEAFPGRIGEITNSGYLTAMIKGSPKLQSALEQATNGVDNEAQIKQLIY